MNAVRFGIDIGGTKTAIVGISPAGEVIVKRVFATEPARGLEDFLTRCKTAYQEALAESGADRPPAAVGVASPGPLDLARGIMYDSPNLHWGDVPLVDRLEQTLETKILLQNDANAAALGEYLFGAGRGSRCLVYVTMSTGIGGGVVVDGRLWAGSSGNAAEFGHLTLVPGGEECGCGLKGCWEAYASGTALARLGRQVTGREVSARDIGRAWSDQAPWADEIIARAARYSGQAVAIIVQSFDPDRLVFGGGVALGLGRRYLDIVLAEAERFCLNFRVRRPHFTLAALGGDSALFGAAALPEANLGIGRY